MWQMICCNSFPEQGAIACKEPTADESRHHGDEADADGGAA